MPSIAEENAYIPASAFLGTMQNLLESQEFECDILTDLFGDLSQLGLLTLTDLRLLSKVGQPELWIHHQTAIDRLSGATTVSLFQR
ncbi:MAG: hypothetical protein Q8K54_13930, partial [Gallionella sp.]|nr:hypothetical protein [Gallionella sp.]